MHPQLHAVVIASYNHEHFISACLESVARQTYPFLELVIVDDGSCDKTPDLIQSFLNTHSNRFLRHIFIKQPNRGVSAALNHAISKTHARWIHILGSDDIIYPQKVEKQAQATMSSTHVTIGMLFADSDLIDEKGSLLRHMNRKRPAPGLHFEAHRWLIRKNVIPNPTVCINRDAILTIGGFDESLKVEDLDAWLRLAMQYPIYRVPELLASTRLHCSNTSKDRRMMFEALWITLAKFARLHYNALTPAEWKRAFGSNARRFLRWVRTMRPSKGFFVLKDIALYRLIPPKPMVFEKYARMCRALRQKTAH